jgi:biopolymer transport protein ExbB
MFLNADIVVKAVMVSLVFASLVTWTIWLAKALELRSAKRRTSRELRILHDVRALDDASRVLDRHAGAGALLVRAAAEEMRLSSELAAAGIKERVLWQIERIEAALGRRMSRGTNMIATIGATAPFVGLFGTVWGIMNSFIGISKAHTTNLAVVAPGIAEALLATALGLFVAIPAVVLYNVFSRSLTGYRGMLGDTAAQIMRLVSRDLDRNSSPLSRAAE